MSFFSDLFQRVPGGTDQGNLLRKVAYDVSGGVFGNGAMIISQVDYDLQNLSDNEYLAKYGKTKTGVIDRSITPNPSIMSVHQQLTTGANKDSTIKLTFVGLLKKYWWIIFFPFTALIVWLVGKLFSNNGNKKDRPYKKRKP